MELKPNGLLAPARWLIGLERSGRLVWTLLGVDALGLGLWLFVLNGFVFGRSLDQDDISTITIVPVLCYAATLQYGLRRDAPWWRWVAKAVIGEAAAYLILRWIFARLGMDLSGRQLRWFFALHLPLHLLGRGIYLGLRRRLPDAPLEVPRLCLVGGVSLGLISGFVTKALIGSGDAAWYSVVLHDFVAQWRAGFFPVFVGQTEYGFVGTVNPLRFAPYFQHFAGVLDLVTGRWLPFVTLQNLAVVVSSVGAGLSAYFCTAAMLPRRRWAAAALALLYVACPGVLALAYSGNLFMSVMALPYVPPVVYGFWLSLQPGDRKGAVRTAIPLAAVWWCHAPVALWLTFLALLVQLVRLASQGRDPAVRRDFFQGAVLFVLCAGYVFISVESLHPPAAVVDRGVILQDLRGAFPANLLPVSENGLAQGDTQLGWSLGAVLLLAAAAFIYRPQRTRGVLLAAASLLLLLIFPVPGVNRWLWQAIPQTVCNITFTNADQRFYVIIAALLAIGGAAAMAAIAGRFPKVARALTLGLALGVGWSAIEAVNFAQQVFNFRPTAAQTDVEEAVNNAVLTRYSFGPFATMPSYYSHGYIDPYLENRVLAADQSRVLLDNAEATRPSDGAPVVSGQPSGPAQGTVVLAPLPLAGGSRYAVRFDPLAPLSPGSLIAEGESIFREYSLPDSGQGMSYRTPARTFGLLPTSRDFFSMWTPRPAGDVVNLRYVFTDPSQGMPAGREWVRIRVQAYDVTQLPVKVKRWAPYEASVQSPAPGAWLETPRLYIAGYQVRVNGRKAAVRRSADGRVLVPLAAGLNQVVLSYSGPGLLRWSYYAALLTWSWLGLRAAAAELRRATSGSRNPHAPRGALG